MSTREDEKETKGEEEGAGAPVGASDGLSEVLPQISTELQEAIKAGAPVVIMTAKEAGKTVVKKTRSFEKGFAVASKSSMDPGDLEVLQKDFLELIGVQDFLMKKARTAEGEKDKAYRERSVVEKRFTKSKARLKIIRDDINTLHKKHKV